jgi:hypothetical protein
MSFWGDPDKGVMKDHQKCTLGYCLTTTKPETVNPPAPTFPPTLLKHQHYKYIAQGKSSADEGLDEGKNNMLLYLEMTQNQPFPREDILEYSGNFITPGMKGSSCISRDLFWDSYLLRNSPLTTAGGGGNADSPPPLLREFNRHAYAWLGDFHIWASHYTAGISWSYGFGHTDWEPSHDASFFAWKKVSPTEWEWSLTEEKLGSDKGVWPFHAYGNASCKLNILWLLLLALVVNTLDCACLSQARALTGLSTAYTKNSLWFNPGENIVHIKGDSRLWVKWGYAGIDSHEES